jgi:hypothetical protein
MPGFVSSGTPYIYMDTEHFSTISHIDVSISNDIHSSDVYAVQDKRRKVK